MLSVEVKLFCTQKQLFSKKDFPAAEQITNQWTRAQNSDFLITARGFCRLARIRFCAVSSQPLDCFSYLHEGRKDEYGEMHTM